MRALIHVTLILPIALLGIASFLIALSIAAIREMIPAYNLKAIQRNENEKLVRMTWL